ncbi:CheR family methyltransferase [Telluribacter sp.]|jgi:two-component system CheB/CheR fusion protein|uniref:CheR family methyltransferase n=1 Tax=Telluribacter sp. TaxID=1978767 RepID=UPI002E1329BC|nr:CheR family methyltransferase [Telluribacter sp.]
MAKRSNNKDKKENKDTAAEEGFKEGIENSEIVRPKPFPIAALGASAGGLKAISELLSNLPADTGIAYIIIQHLSPAHESILPELLARTTSMPVQKVVPRMRVEPDHVYVIPPNTFMSIIDGHLTLSDRERSTGGMYHSIDFFMAALAPVYQNNAIGIILSGTANDGTAGLKAIKAEGGITFAQDESAQFLGMPQSAIDSGFVDYILPPHKIAEELTALLKLPYAVKPPNDIQLENEAELRKIHFLLMNRFGVDFSLYKQTTIKRRILRRMALNRFEKLEEYTTLIKEKTTELDLLYQDLLINVTSFFREPAVFQALGKKIFPSLLKGRKSLDPIRIWIPACSTGEEAYSFAICLYEFLSSKSISTPFQIFATDLDAHAIDKARAGIYPGSLLKEMSAQRLKRFFTAIDGKYQVVKAIRDSCVFATHNLLKDPPFSRIDLVSCQNVLIYIEANPQKKILQSFHYALKPAGFLLLGKSETVGNSTDLFDQIDKDLKIYKKKEGDNNISFNFSIKPSTGVVAANYDKGRYSIEQGTEVDIEKEADKLLLARYVPASVLVNKDLHIIRFHGNTQNYLHPASGKASFHLLKMVRDELIFELRGLIHRARKDGLPVRKEGIPFIDREQIQEVELEVVPVRSSSKELSFLILFKEGTQKATTRKGEGDSTESRSSRKDAKDRRIAILEQELREAREHMKSMSEEFEATREELQSANEEVLSSNEELQSMNEELETSKEELQSTNEELITINEELFQRNIELKESSEYREAIVETIREPLVVLTTDLRVKTANKAFYADFKLSPKETEGNFFFEISNRQWDITGLRKQLTEIISREKSFENFEITHEFAGLGERIMLISAMRMGKEGDKKNRILLVIEDITQRKQAEEGLKRSYKLNSTILNSIKDVFVSVDNDWNFKYVNKRAEAFFGKKATEILGQNLWELFPVHLESEFYLRLTRAMKTKAFMEFEWFDDRVSEWLHYRIYPSEDTLSIYSTNITEQKNGLEQIRQSQERYQTFISRSTEGIWRFELQQPLVTDLPPKKQLNLLFSQTRLEECNDALAQMYGYTSAADIIGFSLDSLLPRNSDSEALMETFVASDYCLSDAEVQETDQEGNQKCFLHNLVGIVEEGRVTRLWGTQRDITRQKQAELALRETQAKLQLALSAGDVGVWLWNIKKDELRWARNAKAGYDLGEKAYQGTFEDWLQFVAPDDQAYVRKSIKMAIAEKRDLSIEFRVMLRAGTYNWIQFQTQTTFDEKGQAEQMLGVNLDINDRKMLEKQKDDFIGIASHELKTPVTSIRAYAELLHQMMVDMEDVASATLVEKMEGQIDRLANLIKDLLDVSRISEGQLQLRKGYFNMNELIQEVTDDIQQSTPRHTIVKELQQVPNLIGDRDRIGQVLINFLSNAIKYSPEAGKVIIYTKADTENVTVCVQDFGVGLTREAQEKVFDRFFRVNDSTNSTFPGIGLGLYISAEIIKKHGGAIWVDSVREHGSKFYFSIPISTPKKR